MSNYLNNIPEHWVVTELENVLASLESGSRPKGGVKNIKEGIPSIGAEHLNSEGSFNFEKLKYIPIEFANRLKKGKIEKENILIVKDGATTGKVSFVDENYPFDISFVNEHVFICKILEGLLKKYFFYYLKSQYGQEQILSTFHGAAQGGISSDFVNSVLIPLPPLNEQKRIVEKLDYLLPKVKQVKARLEKIPVLLKKFRQSILTAACTGKLTEDWRKEHPEILKEFKKQETNNIDIQNLPFDIEELPEGWEMRRIGEIVEINPKNKLNDDLEVSFIPMSLVSSDFNVSPKFEVKKWKEIKKGFTHFKENDVIVAKITPSFENSKAGILKNLINGYGAGTTEIYVLRCRDNVIPQYLYSNIKTNIFIEMGKKMMTGTAGQLRVPKDFIENYLIPLPPLSEQQEIVRRVEKLFAIADKIESQYQKAMERIEKLEQSILAKAFRGELVDPDPDPDDEPAEILLQKILQEKEKLNSRQNLKKKEQNEKPKS